MPPNPPGKGQGPKPTKPFTSAFSYVDAAQKVAELARAVGNITLADQMDKLHTKLGNDFNAYGNRDSRAGPSLPPYMTYP